MKTLHLAAAAAAGALAMLAAVPASATVYTFSTTGATATITTDINTMTIALTDTNANPISEISALAGIQLFLDSAPTAVTLASSSGTLIDIAKGGGVTPDGGTINHWGAGSVGSTLFLETAGPFSAGGQPRNLIVGPGPYTSVNNGFANFDPYIQGTGTFVLNFVGDEGTPVVTGANFSFGTSGVFPAPGGVPEPATWAMMIIGFGGVGAVIRRRRGQMAATLA
jgi:PEP-CTERM motif